MDTSVEHESTTQPAAPLTTFRLRLFAVCWALVALFHLAGNPRPPWIPASGAFVAVHLGVAAAAIAVLVGFRWRMTVVMLCGLIAVSAWLEAPVVGNHWVLAALVSLAYLAAEAGARRRAGSTEEVWKRFAPVARLTVLIAYGFAAFAKLNSDFFDPAVSCAVYYQDQLVRSWGLDALSAVGRPALGTAVAVGAAAVELSVALLLISRRTRRLGLLLGLAFHWLLALDWGQHFWDFSSVLFAVFLLFADDALMEQLRRDIISVRAAVRVPVWRLLAVVSTLGAVAVIVAVSTPGVPAPRGAAIMAGHAAWAVLGTGAVVMVALAVARSDPAAEAASPAPALAMLIVPAIVLANGLTPYLELKTGFGWNMYSNLETVAGESNHLLIPATLDLTGLQRDRIAIVESSDDRLEPLIGSDQEIVYSEFREYAHLYPDEAVTYRRDGRTVIADPLGEDPVAQGTVGLISRKVQSFRVVDAAGAERCQPVFTPAR